MTPASSTVTPTGVLWPTRARVAAQDENSRRTGGAHRRSEDALPDRSEAWRYPSNEPRLANLSHSSKASELCNAPPLAPCLEVEGPGSERRNVGGVAKMLDEDDAAITPERATKLFE